MKFGIRPSDLLILWPPFRAKINLLAPTGRAGSFFRPSHARVVELVDTQVSEACALTACEFESRLGHHLSDGSAGWFWPQSHRGRMFGFVNQAKYLVRSWRSLLCPAVGSAKVGPLGVKYLRRRFGDRSPNPVNPSNPRLRNQEAWALCLCGSVAKHPEMIAAGAARQPYPRTSGRVAAPRRPVWPHGRDGVPALPPTIRSITAAVIDPASRSPGRSSPAASFSRPTHRSTTGTTCRSTGRSSSRRCRG